MGLGEQGGFQAIGLSREHWTGTGPIRTIYEQAFTGAGLPYFNPHCFRDTLVQLGERICSTPEQFKAWSQNIGHERVLTTLTSYGKVPAARQAELIRGLGQGQSSNEVEQVTMVVTEALRRLRQG